MRRDEGDETAVRRAYLVVLAVPIVLVLAILVFDFGAGVGDAYRRIALPGLLLVNGGLLASLWRRWVPLPVVGLFVFLGPAAWVLGRLVTWELVPSTRPANAGLLVAALAWYGVVFSLAFLVFGTRRGAIVALASYLLLYLGATVSAVAGMLADSGAIGVVVFLAAGHCVLIMIVWVLARNVERLAVTRARAELLELQATTDPLTGVANRRRVDEELLLQVARARRDRQPFAVVLVDLDHFKAVNDTYGHEVGDQVLVTAVTWLRSAVRETDLLGRWGGEEFVILAPGTAHEEACALAERCRAAVAAAGEADPGKRVTASLGVATFAVHDDDARSLMRRADLAMYTAKREGRDRVVGIDGPDAGGTGRPPPVAVGE
ncbi:MAG: GGDEF domain-containing protein [Actinobacteria bacterium]|jgi:diguanylate cyclase (GGDEF)-like protein|nr:GGDEF domain-containing protein [Actinomycetota bacterium]